MTAITRDEYEFFKSQNPKDLTQEELNWINEYEKAEASAPSAEDMDWANFILNEKDPQLIAINRKSGDFDEALAIIEQSRAARQLMLQKNQYPYVKKVTSTPDDVVKSSGFKFNWRDAYENVKNEELRPTEADAKKLQDFINSNMYDDVNFQQIAYDLHMYNPNTMKWTDFINSEQGTEFKKYIEDVRKAQTEKAVEDIWSGKDDNDKFRTAAVNFMLPVSKEYAKNHYNDLDFSLIGPLMTDVATNLVMTGPGAAKVLPAKVSAPVAKVMNRPLISTVYGNVAAPAITEAGNVIYNDESIPEALARTAEGTAINIGTPRVLEGTLSWAGRGLPSREGKRTVQKMIDDAANKAAKVNDEIRKGKPYSINSENQLGPTEVVHATEAGKKLYSSDVAASQKEWSNIKFEPIENMPGGKFTPAELEKMKQSQRGPVEFILSTEDGKKVYSTDVAASQKDWSNIKVEPIENKPNNADELKNMKQVQGGPIEFMQVAEDGKKVYSNDLASSKKAWSNIKVEPIENMPNEADELKNMKRGPIEYVIDTEDGKKVYASDLAASKKAWSNIKVESIKNMPNKAVTIDEYSQMKQGLPFARGKDGSSKFSNSAKTLQDISKEYTENDLLIKKAKALAKDGDLRSLTPVDLRQLKFADKESFMNYLIRTIKMNIPSTASSYATNAAGRPEFGRRAGPIRNINYLLGTNLFGKDESVQEKQKSRIQRLLGL